MAKKLYVFLAQDAWFAIAATIAALAIAHASTLVWQRCCRKARTATTSSSRPLSAARAAVATFDNYAHLTKFFGWSLNEMAWVAVYAGSMMLLGFYKSDFKPKPFANQIGYMAFSQMPLIVGLAGKNNMITLLTGIGYEKLNFLHQAAGVTCLICSWCHAIGRLVIGLNKKTNLSHPWMQAGVAAIAFYTLFVALGHPWIRRRFYEAFLVGHILMVFGFLVSCWLHWADFSFWIYPAFVIWGFDRIVRLLRLVVINKLWLLPTAKQNLDWTAPQVEVLDQETMRITLTRPSLSWKPGQHAYLMMPAVANLPFEAHPFTLCGLPTPDGRVHFLLKARDGFTRRLHNIAESSPTPDIRAYVEGSYGGSHSLCAYDKVVLVAGGSGVTFAISHLVDILRSMKRGEAAVREVRLVWMVRSTAALSWITPMLEDEVKDLPAGVSVKLQLHLTQPGGVDAEKTVGYGHVLSATSSGSSLSSPEEAKADDPEKAAAARSDAAQEKTGLPSPLRELVSWHTGRADLHSELASAVSGANGPVVAAVCGPTSLQASARAATKTANQMRHLLGGQAAVTFHAETFGW